MRFLQFGADIEVLVVPEHLDPGLSGGESYIFVGGNALAFIQAVPPDVDEVIGPECALPAHLVQYAIGGQRSHRAIARVLGWVPRDGWYGKILRHHLIAAGDAELYQD
jgi:hypothetical protein